MMKGMFNQLNALLKLHGAENLLRVAVDSLPDELHETVFAVATDIILADGEVTPEEEELLNRLYGILEIPESTARTIIDVMVTKNRG